LVLRAACVEQRAHLATDDFVVAQDLRGQARPIADAAAEGAVEVAVLGRRLRPRLGAAEGRRQKIEHLQRTRSPRLTRAPAAVSLKNVIRSTLVPAVRLVKALRRG